MMARSSTTSFENVKRIGVCIIDGGRARSMRTLTCHSPDFSSTEGVLIVNAPPAAWAGRAAKRTTAAEARATNAASACARRTWAVTLFVGLMARQRLHRLPTSRPRLTAGRFVDSPGLAGQTLQGSHFWPRRRGLPLGA